MREYWLDPPEDDRKVIYKCAQCGEEIRAGDWYFDMGSYELCEECFDHWSADCHKEAEIE